jgi:hypothetical protein
MPHSYRSQILDHLRYSTHSGMAQKPAAAHPQRAVPHEPSHESLPPEASWARFPRVRLQPRTHPGGAGEEPTDRKAILSLPSVTRTGRVTS